MGEEEGDYVQLKSALKTTKNTRFSNVDNDAPKSAAAKINRRAAMQRTSSVDFRRDYSSETWMSLLNLLNLPRELLITVDHYSVWRRHLAWAKRNGKDLRDNKTQRFASSMVFMSLLLNTELNMFFNRADVNTDMRKDLQEEKWWTLGFWAGLVLLFAVVSTLMGLIATLTAWTMHSAVSPANTHCIFRSSIGQYAGALPGRFIVSSLYLFLLWLLMFFFLLVPVGVVSIAIWLCTIAMFVMVIAAFSAFGRLILHTGAMGPEPIFEEGFEALLLPHSLQHNLVNKAMANQNSGISIKRQYGKPQRPLDRPYSDEAELVKFLSSDAPEPVEVAAASGDSDKENKGLHQRRGGGRRRRPGFDVEAAVKTDDFSGDVNYKYGHRHNRSEIDFTFPIPPPPPPRHAHFELVVSTSSTATNSTNSPATPAAAISTPSPSSALPYEQRLRQQRQRAAAAGSAAAAAAAYGSTDPSPQQEQQRFLQDSYNAVTGGDSLMGDGGGGD